MKMKYCNGIQSFPAGANETSRKKNNPKCTVVSRCKGNHVRIGRMEQPAFKQSPGEHAAWLQISISLSLPKNRFMKSDVILQEAQCSKSCWSLGFLAHHLAFLAHQTVCTGMKQLHGAVRSPRHPPNLGCTSPDNSPAHHLLSLTTGGRLPGNRTPPSAPPEETLHPTASASKRGWRRPFADNFIFRN